MVWNTKTLPYYRTAICYGDPPCADTFFLGFAGIFPPKRGSQRSKYGGRSKLSHSVLVAAGSLGTPSVVIVDKISRQPPDYSSNLCPSKTFAILLFESVLGGRLDILSRPLILLLFCYYLILFYLPIFDK